MCGVGYGTHPPSLCLSVPASLALSPSLFLSRSLSLSHTLFLSPFDLVAHAVRDGGVDRVLGDVPPATITRS